MVTLVTLVACAKGCPVPVANGGTPIQMTITPAAILVPPDWTGSRGTGDQSENLVAETKDRSMILSVIFVPGSDGSEMPLDASLSPGQQVDLRLADGRVIPAEEVSGEGSHGYRAQVVVPAGAFEVTALAESPLCDQIVRELFARVSIG
jgi:hypothetical protein